MRKQTALTSRRTYRIGLLLAGAVVAISVSGGVTYAAVSADGGSGNTALPPGKQQALDRAAAEQAQISAAAKSKVKPADRRPPAGASRLPARVGGLNTEVHSGPMRADQFAVTDSWQGLLAGKWLYVIAGTDLRAGTGAVAVYTLPTDPNIGNDPTLLGVYDAASTATLTITHVDGTDVLLQSQSGTAMTFDLNERSFS